MFHIPIQHIMRKSTPLYVTCLPWTTLWNSWCSSWPTFRHSPGHNLCVGTERMKDLSLLQLLVWCTATPRRFIVECKAARVSSHFPQHLRVKSSGFRQAVHGTTVGAAPCPFIPRQWRTITGWKAPERDRSRAKAPSWYGVLQTGASSLVSAKTVQRCDVIISWVSPHLLIFHPNNRKNNYWIYFKPQASVRSKDLYFANIWACWYSHLELWNLH